MSEIKIPKIRFPKEDKAKIKNDLRFNHKKIKVKTGGLKKALLIPDCHIPSHDHRDYDLMLKIAKDLNPDEIVILGDYCDFYSVSQYCKDPEKLSSLKDEVEICKKYLRQLRQLFPKSNIVYLEGNHEDRFSRYIALQAPALFGSMDVPSILDLANLRIKFVPFTPDQAYKVCGSKLLARHCPLSGGIHAAYQTVAKGLSSFVYGHTHRSDEASIVSMSGKNYRAFCPGWLGDKRDSAFDYVKGHHQWTSGVGIAYILPNMNFTHQLIHFVDHSCVFNGKFYEN